LLPLLVGCEHLAAAAAAGVHTQGAVRAKVVFLPTPFRNCGMSISIRNEN
jgi:hypothetical protein